MNATIRINLLVSCLLGAILLGTISAQRPDDPADTEARKHRPEIGQELKFTDEQRQQFVGVVQDMRKQLVPLMKEAHSGGNRQEIRARATQIYGDEEVKIEAILNAT